MFTLRLNLSSQLFSTPIGTRAIAVQLVVSLELEGALICLFLCPSLLEGYIFSNQDMDSLGPNSSSTILKVVVFVTCLEVDNSATKTSVVIMPSLPWPEYL